MMEKIDLKISCIQIGWGQDADQYRVGVNGVDEIIPETKPITSKEWMRVYRGYRNNICIFEIESKGGLIIFY